MSVTQPPVMIVAFNGGANISINASLGNYFYGTLTGNRTFTITGGTPGQKITVRFEQDATGGRTVTPDGTVNFGDSPTSFAIAAGVGAVSKIGLEKDPITGLWDCEALATGF